MKVDCRFPNIKQEIESLNKYKNWWFKKKILDRDVEEGEGLGKGEKSSVHIPAEAQDKAEVPI